ncbi:MAG: aminotransferase class I/II-fold pyridoxal phosphate-dependent enzyme [Acidobacteriota bacterium]|nr:aminotransferase class I/II-fold pyridoxal phosphate-dependent enzyme [Acidobacteriota bacterium]
MAKKVTGAKTPGRGDATHAVHAGEDRHGRRAPLTTEIVQSSVFVLPKLDDLRRIANKQDEGYLYTRYANPTIAAAEKKMAALENGECCVITSSGMAAILSTFLTLSSAGDEIVSMLDVYGGTLKLCESVLTRCDIKTHFVPFDELGKVEKYFNRKTKLLFLESPTNPILRCVDLAELARRAHKHGVTVVVDNTFATPVLQKPLELGADIVVHSATKYLGGHSDVTAGCVIGPKEVVEKARDVMLTTGGSLDPGAGYLLLRGLKTLELRMLRGCENAARIAEAMARHPRVEKVMYPGLAGHAGHDIARSQMRGFGAMVAFEIKGGSTAAERFIDALELWYLATSLGGVESTVSYPMLSSHFGTSSERLKWLGIGPATVRLSAGIEDAEDLIADLNQALART